ncbi:putative polysaccharide biosynthesis protein [Symbiobacterium thermophilum]|uniref:putative polysaccharide biosynthesis protein n=1 Tax=Symbiobacterium thermophilum TaxID=2734 RepID=UPI0023563557|nr:polysaccharide biosynthesis protein [Symbiobacterium thermophilum]
MQQSRSEGFVRGALLITAGSLISRILGVFYRPVAQIPLGEDGLALVSPPNAPYMLILAVSSTGLNVAVSRLVSQRLAVGDLRGARRVVRLSATVLGVLGLIFSVLFALAAPWMARVQGFPEATPGFLALAPAILMVTLEVSLRGLYQGMQQMRPAAMTMVIEQVGRVVVGLTGVFLLTPIALNLGAAAFNAGNTVGVFLGLVYVAYIYLRDRPMRDWTTVAPGVESWEKMSTWRLMREILAIAMPLSFLGAVLPLTQLADTALITNRLIAAGTDVAEAKRALSYITNATQLRDLPIIFAQALYVSLIPAISESMALGREEQARHRAAAAMRLTWLIGLPATIGLVAAARDAYGVLFTGPGWYVMAPLGWSTIFLMLQQTSSGILQGLGLIWLSVWNQLLGVVVKIVLTWWWTGMPALGASGAAWATTVGFLLSAGLNLWVLRRRFGLGIGVRTNILRPLAASAVMAAALLWISPLLRSAIGWARLSGVAVIAVGILVYGAALLVLGGIRRADLELVPGVPPAVIDRLRRLRLLRDS